MIITYVSMQVAVIQMGNNDLEDEVEANCMASNIIPLVVTTARDKCPSIEFDFLLTYVV